MKNWIFFKTLPIFLLVIFIASSCSVTKKTAMDCPTLPRSNSNTKVASNLKKLNHKILTFSQKKSKRNHLVSNHITSKSRVHKTNITATAKLNNQTYTNYTSQVEKVIFPDKIEYNNNLTVSVDNSRTLVKTTYSPSVTFKSISEIGSINSIPISNISFINNSNNLIYSYSSILTNEIQDASTAKKVQGLALAGFITSLSGLLILPLPCGIVGLILSIIGLSKINKNPSKYKGKGFAIAGIVVGLVNIVFGILVIGGAFTPVII